MREIPVRDIAQTVEELCIQANYDPPDDVRRALHAPQVSDFPVAVGQYIYGQDIHKIGRTQYRRHR